MFCTNCLGQGVPEMIEVRKETQTQHNLCYMETEYICKNCGRREISQTLVRTLYEGKKHDDRSGATENISQVN